MGIKSWKRDDTFCLIGAWHHLRALHGKDDRAGEYLGDAMEEYTGPLQNNLTQFNDFVGSYERLKLVIVRARELAYLDAKRGWPPLI